ncbi:MAG: DNA polymerase III subunit gamma/tau [Cyanobacteria bacterium P01_H01_bin.121]
MVYEPLHHKYRPQCFQDLVGQTAIATTLTNAIQQQRIAPAYLFTGPRGTGKTSSARILAKSLNCLSTDGPTATPCGQCDACVRIANGSALDVIEIDAASNTGVDNIRELIERSQFAPVQCRYKVYVVDECHMLSTAAFNALLKTLEEPPDRVVFVLATTDPQRVLATIISRCQRFDFRRIPLEAMVQHLQYIASQEQIEIDDPAIRLVAQIAQGGLRDAESLLDQLSLLEPPLTAEAVWDLVGAVPERDLFALVQAIAADRPEQVLDQARHLMNRGREPLIVLQNLTSFYRDLLIAKTAPQRQDLVAMTATTWQQLCEFAGNLDLAVILQGQQHLKTSAVQIKNTTQPRLWLEVTLLGLLPATVRSQLQNINQAGTTSASNAQVSIQSASSNPTARSQPPLQPQQPPPLPAVPAHSPALNTAPPPADPTQSQSPESAVPPPTSPAEPQQLLASESSINLTEIWQRALARIASKATQTLLRQQGKLIDIKGNHASISLIKRWRDNSVSRVEIIEAALAAVLDLPTFKVQWVDP